MARKSSNGTKGAAKLAAANTAAADTAARVEAATAWARADKGAADALTTRGNAQLAMLACAAQHGEFTPADLVAGAAAAGVEMPENSAKVRASQFNAGAKLARVMGVAGALEFLTKVSGAVVNGKRFQRTLEAVRGVVKEADAKPLAPAAAKAATARAVESAKVVKLAAAKGPDSRAAKADEPEAPRTVALDDVATHAEAARAVRTLYAALAKMNPPKGGADLTAFKAMVSALGKAADAAGGVTGV